MAHRERDGDVFEVPLGGAFGYIVSLVSGGYGVYTIQAQSRPSLDQITESTLLEVVYMGDRNIRSGNWQYVGRDKTLAKWRPPPVRYAIPSNPGRFLVSEQGHVRPATEEDMSLPLQVRMSEVCFIEFLRKQCTFELTDPPSFPPPVRHPRLTPLQAAMSVDRNDLAEQVKQVFAKEVERSGSGPKALKKAKSWFAEALTDDDRALPCWLALADLALKYDCLTAALKKQALKLIEADESFDVVESWSEKSDRTRARELRRVALAGLKKRLEEQS